MYKMVSIIVPVYNVTNYLNKCLDSLLKQDFSDYEILLIDDGSTDDSFGICERYAEKFSRIKLYSKKNGGLSDARNYALDRSNGLYIMFVDGDDYVPENCLSIMIDQAIKSDADIICGGFERFTNAGKVLFKNVPEKSELLDNYSAMKEMISEGKTNTMACTKLFKKELFEKIRFPIGKLHEDIYTMHYVFAKASSICILDEIVYYYRVNPCSITEGKFKAKRQDAVYAHKDRYDYICKYYPKLKNIELQFYIWNCVNNNYKIIKERYPKEFFSYFRENNDVIRHNFIEFMKSKASYRAKTMAIVSLMLDALIAC